MPYLSKQQQEQLTGEFKRMPEDPGELNFAITSLCIKYLASKAGRYCHYNDVIGALESAKLEFYARAVRPYEDEKIKANGDVYK